MQRSATTDLTALMRTAAYIALGAAVVSPWSGMFLALAFVAGCAAVWKGLTSDEYGRSE